MAGYIRQSTFVDGDTITAALFNNEYNQLVNAFSNTSGHKHCLLYTSPSPRDAHESRMPSSA